MAKVGSMQIKLTSTEYFLTMVTCFGIIAYMLVKNWMCYKPQLKLGQKVKAYISLTKTIKRTIKGKYVVEEKT
jgi:hypothetical protein